MLQVIHLNGVPYVYEPPMEMRSDSTDTRVVFPERKVPVNRCKHCGRADWFLETYRNIQDAINAGAFVPYSELTEDSKRLVVLSPGMSR